MRADMSRVIVERPRRGGIDRRGRALPFDDLPQHEGMRRPHTLVGDRKGFNETLAPLRRYLERQVGRPWNKVYSEIATHLRANNTVQQHVRDHLRDFVAVKPRRHNDLYANPFSGLWRQPLYVDEKDGILKRTDRLPEEKARWRARRNPPPRPVDCVALAADCELRRIEGFWYELRLAPMPDPVYRALAEHRRVPLKPLELRGGRRAGGGGQDRPCALVLSFKEASRSASPTAFCRRRCPPGSRAVRGNRSRPTAPRRATHRVEECNGNTEPSPPG